MSLLTSLVGTLVVAAAVSGAPAPEVPQQAPYDLSDPSALQQVADCDQGQPKFAPGALVPRLELHVKPLKEESGAKEDKPTGFCAAFFGPVDGGARCDFRLLA